MKLNKFDKKVCKKLYNCPENCPVCSYDKIKFVQFTDKDPEFCCMNKECGAGWIVAKFGVIVL
ncbi:hypothetical protein GF386_04010 [Candidatus Pacearchaeota archaeon]|nr:hypothetical protein [Candidatus Pacearchaeota archaeon]